MVSKKSMREKKKCKMIISVFISPRRRRCAHRQAPINKHSATYLWPESCIQNCIGKSLRIGEISFFFPLNRSLLNTRSLSIIATFLRKINKTFFFGGSEKLATSANRLHPFSSGPAQTCLCFLAPSAAIIFTRGTTP